MAVGNLVRRKGKITSWNDDKGFGFLSPFDGSKQVFVHIKAFGRRNLRPQLNDVVTFSMSQDKQGRPCAANAVLAGEKLVTKVANKRNALAIGVAILFLLIVAASVALDLQPLIVGITYAGLSLITFGVYAWDKASARMKARRTPERTLLLLGLAGGWPGALVAQQIFRHKSKKVSFVISLWITALTNAALFFWLHTERGQSVLQAILN